MTEHLLGPLTREQSDTLAVRITEHFHREGFGFWAVEAPSIASFVGMVGISIPSYTAPFTPCVKVGWRLSRKYWGQALPLRQRERRWNLGLKLLTYQKSWL